VTGRLRSGALLWLLAVVTLALDGIALAGQAG
jgi:hypothetical protein